jgi:signal recognition particle subunit SRP54
MGDVVSLVERAAETIKADEAEAMAAKMAKGQFDMNDLRNQLSQMRRMGGLGALAGMLPGLKKAQSAMAQSGMGDKTLIRMEAMVDSMTPKERVKPEIINAKRKIRIAKGSGTTVQEVNKLLKMHQEMSTAMKKIKKMGGLKGLASMLGGAGGGGLGGLLGGMGAGMGAGMGGGSMPSGPAGGMPGAGGAPFNLPPGFDKFLKK